MTPPDADVNQGMGGRIAMPIRFDASGVVPVIAQDEATGDVFLLAYMNEEALRRTLTEGVLVLWSRSRGQLWRKGEQSGHTLRVSELRVNCESNSLLARVRLVGPGACHEGYRTCYFRRMTTSADGIVQAEVVEERTFDPETVYGRAGLRDFGQTPSVPTVRATETQTEAQTADFERAVRELYTAYERLRDEDHTATSATSALLHRPDREAAARHAVRRGRDELGELKGVVAGTHRHYGGGEDVILEAGQVQYWAMVAAVAVRCSYDAWRPHGLWLAGLTDSAAELLPRVDGVLGECVELIRAAADQCRAASMHPARVVAADLAAMHAKYPHGDAKA